MMSMLPENQKVLEYYVRLVKDSIGELLDYVREGSYGAGEGRLYYLSDVMLYLVDLLKSDDAGRVAESFHDWVEKKFEEARQVGRGMFSK
jgi:hypothetical protein